MTDQQRQELIDAAIEARGRAYAKYSNYQVGAALLGGDGQIVTGCNVENVSYGLAICAERAAVFNAVASGMRSFAAIAVATDGGASPCGACRQVLAEFCDDLLVLLVDASEQTPTVEVRLKDLLPGRFELPPRA